MSLSLTSRLPWQLGPQGPHRPSSEWFLPWSSSPPADPPALPRCPGRLTSVACGCPRFQARSQWCALVGMQTQQGGAVGSPGSLPAGRVGAACLQSQPAGLGSSSCCHSTEDAARNLPGSCDLTPTAAKSAFIKRSSMTMSVPLWP